MAKEAGIVSRQVSITSFNEDLQSSGGHAQQRRNKVEIDHEA